MKLKRPRSRARVAYALAALGSSLLLAGGVLASPAAASTDFYAHLHPHNTYELYLAVSQGSTSPGAPVIDWFYDGGEEQVWHFFPLDVPAPNGRGAPVPDLYEIINENSHQCLTTDGVAGDQVYQDPCDGSPSQQWLTGVVEINDGCAVGGGVCTPDGIQSVSSGLYLDVSGDSIWPGAEIDTWYENDGANQWFQPI